MMQAKSARQRRRKARLLVIFLLFPIIMNYMSPYVIIDGASQGIVNGSLVVFGLLFISALFFGRYFCGYFCPAGALQEICLPINDQLVKGSKIGWIKWAVWVPWVLIIVGMVISAGGYRSVDLLLDTQGGISVAGDIDRPIIFAYLIYYIVIGLFAGLAIFAGRRAGCYTICWMAPFMILGRKLRNLGNWPALRLKAEPERCTDCKTCTTNCPMSLDVNAMVKLHQLENSECILCATCIDGCSKKVLSYSFSSGK